MGEVLAEREAGKTADVLKTQITGALAGITAEAAKPIVIAYEPVWAIGTGKTATPEMAVEAHKIIRAEVARLLGAEVAAAVRILYGGSVKPDTVSYTHLDVYKRQHQGCGGQQRGLQQQNGA